MKYLPALKLVLQLDRRAVTSIEYALIAAFIAVVIVGAVTQVGINLPHSFNTVASEL
jgi:pilus assembly protein Flp/PilA